MQISAFRGSLTVTSFRLCSRAPWTTSSSAAIAPTILLGERTFPFLCHPGRCLIVGGALTNPKILRGVPFVEYAVDNGVSGDLVSDLGLFPFADSDRVLLPTGFPRVCPAPGLMASIYGYLPLRRGGGAGK